MCAVLRINVGLRKWLNLYKCGFKVYDLLVFVSVESRRLPSVSFESRNLYSKDLQTVFKHKYTDNVTDIGFILWNI